MSKAADAVKAALRESYHDNEKLWTVGVHKQPNFKALAEIAAKAAVSSLFPQDVVVASYPWRDNADLIYAVWRMGYVEGKVLDMTPGEKGLWASKLWRPPEMKMVEGIEGVYLNFGVWDFTNTPSADNEWDTVFYDPPFKLNGNPDGLPDLSRRYGVDVPAHWEDRHQLMVDGLKECIRITSGRVLAKCQDQVVNGEIRWQTDMLKDCAEANGCKKVDRFDMLGHHIPQPMGPSKRYPNGRKQRHAHARPSTLLVFEKRAS